MLLRAHQAEMIGAAAFHEAQIVGVIDDAGKLRPDVIVPRRNLDLSRCLDGGA
jgi:hypothetical protein